MFKIIILVFLLLLSFCKSEYLRGYSLLNNSTDINYQRIDQYNKSTEYYYFYSMLKNVTLTPSLMLYLQKSIG